MVRIKMEIPENCSECPLLKRSERKDYFQCIPDGRYMYDVDKVWILKRRPNWCPMDEIINCENCGYHSDEPLDKNMVWCNLHRFARPRWHYCADGKRK